MRAAFFSLLLTAVHVVDCRPRLDRESEELSHHHQQRSLYRQTPKSAAHMDRFSQKQRGAARKTHREILLGRTDNFVSIFDLRRKRFICIDLKGALYTSRHWNRDDCLFQRVLENHRNVLHSTDSSSSSGGGGGRRAEHHRPLESSSSSSASTLLEKFRGLLAKRTRRSEEVNPSDPLRTQTHPTHSVKDHKDTSLVQPEQDQTGAVSKETISSCDDPLRVLDSQDPVSPVKTNIAEQAEQE